MKLTWFGTAWAAIKGAFSFGTTAKLAIIDYLLEVANAYVQSADEIVANVARTYAALVTICDRLDYYAKYVPVPWEAYYANIGDALKSLRDALADGKVEREEVEKFAEAVKAAVAAWNK